MPLNTKGKKIMSAMKKQYGSDKGESVFYASRNKGTIKGVEGKMHTGGVIPKTGLYEMEKGETVLPSMTKTREQIQNGEATKPNRPGGTDESSMAHQNAPFRSLHEGGHDLNHTYKNPVPNAAGVNHSYAHPLVHPNKENSPHAQARGNRVKPLSQVGSGKS